MTNCPLSTGFVYAQPATFTRVKKSFNQNFVLKSTNISNSDRTGSKYIFPHLIPQLEYVTGPLLWHLPNDESLPLFPSVARVPLALGEGSAARATRRRRRRRRRQSGGDFFLIGREIGGGSDALDHGGAKRTKMKLFQIRIISAQRPTDRGTKNIHDRLRSERASKQATQWSTRGGFNNAKEERGAGGMEWFVVGS